jgi:hypothetical protein
MGLGPFVRETVLVQTPKTVVVDGDNGEHDSTGSL